jgi:Protein of unknown function (DUF3102)
MKKEQGRKAIIIPDDPRLDDHAKAIRRCASRCFEDVVEMGERLIECRALLKDQRVWLAWLKAEFQWSRRHADRLIAVAKNRKKCATLRTLGIPMSAIYPLADASPALIERVKQRVAAGERVTARSVPLLVFKHEPPTPVRRVVHISPPIISPPTIRTIPSTVHGPYDLHTASLHEFSRKIETFASEVRHLGLEEVAAAVPPEKRKAVAESARGIVDFMQELGRRVSELLVGDGGTSH